MKQTILTGLLFLLVCIPLTINGQKIDSIDQFDKGVFFEIVLKLELGNSNSRIKKWVKDVKIFIKNPEQKELVEEFEIVIKELNELSSTISIERVENESDANFVIFFSGANEYSKYEPASYIYIKENWGLFFCYWNKNNEIYKGSMYVDIERTKGISCRKHLLREELTQALGLMNDSDKYDDSIFYQQWTCSPSYSKIDKDVITLFLSSKIAPNMSKEDVCKTMKWNCK